MFDIRIHYNSDRVHFIPSVRSWRQSDGFLLVSFSDIYNEAYNLSSVRCITFLENTDVQK